MGGLVRGRLLIWGDAMCLRARIRSFKPPELHFLSFYHNLEVDKDCLVTQLCLFCIVTSLKILASYTLLPLLMYSCKFQLRNSIFIIRYTITCALNDQSCRCAIKQHSFITTVLLSLIDIQCIGTYNSIVLTHRYTMYRHLQQYCSHS